MVSGKLQSVWVKVTQFDGSMHSCIQALYFTLDGSAWKTQTNTYLNINRAKQPWPSMLRHPLHAMHAHPPAYSLWCQKCMQRQRKGGEGHLSSHSACLPVCFPPIKCRSGSSHNQPDQAPHTAHPTSASTVCVDVPNWDMVFGGFAEGAAAGEGAWGRGLAALPVS